MQGEFSLHHFSTSDCINTSRNDRVPLITLEKKIQQVWKSLSFQRDDILHSNRPLATNSGRYQLNRSGVDDVWWGRCSAARCCGGKPSALCIFIPRLPFRHLPQSMWQFVVPAVLHLWLTALEKRREFFVNLGDLCSGFGECSQRNSEDISRTHLVNKTKNNL